LSSGVQLHADIGCKPCKEGGQHPRKNKWGKVDRQEKKGGRGGLVGGRKGVVKAAHTGENTRKGEEGLLWGVEPRLIPIEREATPGGASSGKSPMVHGKGLYKKLGKERGEGPSIWKSVLGEQAWNRSSGLPVKDTKETKERVEEKSRGYGNFRLHRGEKKERTPGGRERGL